MEVKSGIAFSQYVASNNEVAESLPSQNLKSYLEQEHQNKKGKPWDSSGWDFEFFAPVSLLTVDFAHARKRLNRLTEAIVGCLVAKRSRR
jgi:hypothetical protein